MKVRYTLSLGDSNTDGIGLVFEIETAKGEAAATATANEVLQQFVEGFECLAMTDDGQHVNARVFAGPQLTVTAEDIDDTYDLEDVNEGDEAMVRAHFAGQELTIEEPGAVSNGNLWRLSLNGSTLATGETADEMWEDAAEEYCND